MSKRKRVRNPVDRGVGADIGDAPNVNLHYLSRVRMTLDMAFKLLQDDDRAGNRPVSDSLVRRFARLMLAGKWHLDGNPIKQDQDGKLLDGQHRLWAFVMAAEANPDVEVYFSFVRGVSRDSLIVMDTGRARKFGDFLAIQGKKNSAATAAAARWLWWYDELRRGNLTSSGGATNPEMAQAIARHPLIFEAIEMTIAANEAKTKVPPGTLGFVITKGLEIDRACTETFLYGLNVGAGLEEGSPILLLRRKMDRIKSGVDTSEAKSPLMRCALTVKAWNLFKDGKTLKKLLWSPVHGESFPAFSGE